MLCLQQRAIDVVGADEGGHGGVCVLVGEGGSPSVLEVLAEPKGPAAKP